MSIALVAHSSASATGSSQFTTSGIDTTGATLLVANLTYYNGAVSGQITDSYGNTWVAFPVEFQSDTAGRLFYCSNPTVGAGHTFTCTDGSYSSMQVAAFSGVTQLAPLDVTAAATGSAASANGGSVTPTNANSLVISGIAFRNVVGLSGIDSGFTITDTVNPGSVIAGSLAYLVQTTATGEDPTWSLSGGASWGVTNAVFIAGSVTVPTTPAVVSSVDLNLPGATTATSSAIDTTGATLLVANLTSFGVGGMGTLSDSYGNTWTALTQRTNSNYNQRLFYAVNPTVGTGHTFTVTTPANGSLQVAAFSGVRASSPFDVGAGATGTGDAQAGSVTPTNAGSLIVAGIAFQNVGWQIVGLDSDLKIIQMDPAVGAPIATVGGAIAFVSEGAGVSSSRNPTWNFSSSGAAWGAQNAVFVSAGSTQTISPSGIAPTVAFGTLDAAGPINPSGIAPTVAFGTPSINNTLLLSPSGIAPTVAFGTPQIIKDLQFARPAGIGQTIAFGIPTIAGPLSPSGIAPTVAFGTPKITTSQTILPSGIAPTAAFGTLRIGNSQTIAPSGIAPTVAFGTPKVSGSTQLIRAQGIAPTVAFGSDLVASGGDSRWRAWLGGRDCTTKMQVGTARVTGQAVARFQLTFTMYDSSGTFCPIIGQQFMVTEGNIKWFAGVIVEVKIRRNPKTLNELFFDVTCSDYTAICDRRLIKTFTWPAGMDIADVWRAIIANWLTGENITGNHIPASLGALESDFQANYDSVTTKLNELASFAGVVWWVDLNQDMHASGLADLPAAPFGIVDRPLSVGQRPNWRNLTMTISLLQGDGYRNIEYAISNLTTTTSTVPTQDFTTTLPQPGNPADFLFDAITLPLAASRVTGVTVNGTPFPVFNLDDAEVNPRQIWWVDTAGSIYLQGPNPANNLPSLPDPPSTAPDPSPGDTVVVTYIPAGDNNVAAVQGEALDPASIVPAGVTPFGNLNTIGSGIWEAVALGQDADTQEELNLLANSELARSGGIPFIIDFETDQPGLAVGQLLPVNMPGLFAPTKQMLIVQISGQEMAVDATGVKNDLGFGSCWRWTVQAKTDLDAFGTWVNFYEKLIQRTKLPRPLPIYSVLSFVLGPGGSLAGGTFVSSPDVVPNPPGILAQLILAAANPPVGQDVKIDVVLNGEVVASITMPDGTPANTAVIVNIDPTASPIYLFQGDIVNVNATYSITGSSPTPTPLANGILKINYQV